jgi:hypothetical protein
MNLPPFISTPKFGHKLCVVAQSQFRPIVNLCCSDAYILASFLYTFPSLISFGMMFNYRRCIFTRVYVYLFVFLLVFLFEFLSVYLSAYQLEY